MFSQQFQIFMRVVECGSFSKAAKIAYITPASIMKHINSLEDRLGVILFERNSRGVTVTSAGKYLYNNGKKIVNEVNKAIKNAQNIQKEEIITIKIGSSFLNPCSIITNLLHDYKEYFEKYKIEIIPYDDNKDNILSVVASLGKRIDILVGAFNSKKMQSCANYCILGNYKLCIAVSRNHFLAKRKALKFKDLYDEHLMMVKFGDTSLLDNFYNILKKDHPKIIIEETDYYYDIDTFNICEQKEFLLLTLDAWKNIHPNLITIPLDIDFKIPYGILYSMNPQKYILNFIEIIEKIQRAKT